MTLQTSAPLTRAPLSRNHRPGTWLVRLFEQHMAHTGPERTGYLELDAPYQRGQVWSKDQQRLLIKAFLLGVPVPAIIVNDRFSARFTGPDGKVDNRLAVIDGKQRTEAILAWFDNHLDVPASWFPADVVTTSTPTADGPYVRFADLTETGQRHCSHDITLLVAEAQVATLAEEAELYLLVNRSGTPMEAGDFTVAQGLTGTA